MLDFGRFVFPECNDAIVRKVYDEAILPPDPSIIVIAEGGDPLGWQDAHARELAVPGGYVGTITDAFLSGHACLWKDDRFVSFNSYLSFVAETETRGGAWQTPWTHRPTRTLDMAVTIGFSAGYGCFGHWLVDDIPRLALLKQEMGNDFTDIKIILPKRIPQFAKTILEVLLGVRDDSIIYFDHQTEMLALKTVHVSSYQHENYNFNDSFRQIYSALMPRSAAPSRAGRRICLSRQSWEKDEAQPRRFFERRIFEDMAAEAAFEIVALETMSIRDQISLVAEAAIIIGEHGSAQHMSIFAPEHCVVGTVNPLTPVQTNLGRLYANRNVLLVPDVLKHTGPGVCEFSCSKAALDRFFAVVG